MLSFPEIVRIIACFFEVMERPVCLAVLQRLQAQQEMCRDILARYQPFSAFPWMEAARFKRRESIRALAGQVVQRDQFHGQVVALINQVPAMFQFPEAGIRADAGPFAELVEFIKQAGVGRHLRGTPRRSIRERARDRAAR